MYTLNKLLNQLDTDFSNPAEKVQQDKLVTLVETMLELQKKHQTFGLR